MARTIHCTVIEAPTMTDTLRDGLGADYFDLAAWVDPYIVGLIEKVRHSDSHLLLGSNRFALLDEAAPPLDVDTPEGDSPDDNWSRRGE